MTLSQASAIPPSVASVSGTVTGLPAAASGDEYFVTYGWSFAVLSKSQTTGTFTFSDVPVGPHDLVVVHWPPSSPFVDTIAIIHDLVAPATNVALDWSSAGIATANVSIVDSNATTIQGGLGLATPTSFGLLGFVDCSTSPCNAQISSLPVALAKSTDANYFWIGASAGTTEWSFEAWSTAIADSTITPPPSLANVSATLASSMPYPRIATTWRAYNGAAGYSWFADDVDRVWHAVIGADYAGASPSFEMPDLSQIPGWSTNTFGLVPTSFVRVSVFASLVEGNLRYDDVITGAYWPYQVPPAKLTSVGASQTVHLP